MESGASPRNRARLTARLAVAAIAAAGLLPTGALAHSTGRFVLTSPAIRGGGTIPRRYTCDGAGVSPPLRWTAPPHGTTRLRLLVTDPDAPGGRFVHWQATRLPPRAGSVAAGQHLPGEGLNGFGTRGWGAPCPPAGQSHRYVFVLDALGSTGRVLAKASLVARYARP